MAIKSSNFTILSVNCLLLKYPLRILTISCACLLSLWSSAQFPASQDNLSNLRKKKFAVADTLRLDSLSIVPKSVSITGISATDYEIDFVNALLYWKQKPTQDSVQVSYRVFPYKLNAITRRYNYDSVSKIPFVIPFSFNNNAFASSKNLFDFGELNTQGSFGRQISFGNSQDAVLNSTLNLQMQGMLGDSIEVHAAITDNNIPIQPEGNTQQLNEFDKVFLQFKKRGWQLDLGDIDIRQNQSYFLNFYKRLQGIAFQTNNRLSKNINSSTLVSGSVAKGKFTRNIIDRDTYSNLEGNQGPYKLRGANDELFFIVLANTERVFLDGELLQRGEDQDYIIDYNTAEITFTPKRMITKDTRIQVEFEYADRNFLNANLYLSQDLEIKKNLKLHIGVYNNSDAKNSTINQELDDKQKKFLVSLGDSVQNALYPNAVLDTFAAGKILYEKIYFNPGSGIDSFYQYSVDPSAAKYNLSFVDVGPGNGNYNADANGANGKVYKYIPPVGGVKQGRFEPAIRLVTPKKQQLLNFGLNWAVGRQTTFNTELATSNYDANTFSKKDNGDDRGFAAKFQFNNIKPLRNAAERDVRLLTALDYEYVQDKFKPLERLRQVEFSRDWGLPFSIRAATENILRASAELKDGNIQSITYQFSNYNRSDNYTGFQNSLVQIANLKGWLLNNAVSLTNYKTDITKGYFLRPVIDVSKELTKLSNWRLGFRYTLEDNQTKAKETDSLILNSFSFNTYSVYLQSNQNRKNKYGLTFFTRKDKSPAGKQMANVDRSYNVNLQAELTRNEKHRLFLNTTFRKLEVLNPSLTTQKADNTILGRVEYLVNEWKGLLNGSVLYEVGAGQEQKRDIVYLEVPAGRGQYAWIDYNNDGVQQLNEFEIAAFPDQAKFIRIFTPTNEFVKANYTTLNYSVSLNPRVVIDQSKAKGFKKILAKSNFQTGLQISKKSVAKGDFEFNPFKYGLSDTALITLATSIPTTYSFNRYSSVWGFDIINLQNSGKSLLTYGYESRKLNDWFLKTRWNLSRSIGLDITTKKGLNVLSTSNAKFENRNYRINEYSTEPRITYIRGTKLRLTAGYAFDQKKNDSAFHGGQKAISNALNLESRYNVLKNVSVTARFTFNNINFSAPDPAFGANSTVGYIMLNGLLPGRNYLWGASLTKSLFNNIELRFEYEGRKPGDAKTIHRGTASLNALF
jgi:hypothetical protein